MVSGFLSGVSMSFYRSSSLTLYTIWKLVEVREKIKHEGTATFMTFIQKMPYASVKDFNTNALETIASGTKQFLVARSRPMPNFF